MDLAAVVDRMASREFLDFSKTQKMDMGLLQEMKILLNTVNAVLDDAEEKHGTTQTVKIWLDDLRDAAYEAYDLLDLIAYEAKSVNGLKGDAKTLLKDKVVPRSPKARSPKSPVGPAKYQMKAAQYVSPKCAPRRIHQPR